MSKIYCMECKKEVNEEVELCECNSRSFVYGEDFTLGADSINCDCGNDKFIFFMHMNYKHKSIRNYKCSNCDCENPIGIETYRTEKEMMYYEDGEI